MGLFSKKTLVCTKCGREFQARLAFGEPICDDCLTNDYRRHEYVKGYEDFAKKMHWLPYPEETIDAIINHKSAILEKYRAKNGITRQELMDASENYKSLTEYEAVNIVRRLYNSTLEVTIGAAYNEYFFLPTSYENTIVDCEDIFAVGYVTDYKLHTDINNEAILCVIFTNDPYLPVFSMIYLGKIGLFDFMKSKKGRQGINVLFESMCPNLTYPVQELKKLKKQIKEEGLVRGNIDMNVMLDMISNASYSSGIFNTKNMTSDLPDSTINMIGDYGYILNTEIDEILKTDKMFNKKFWKKQFDNYLSYNFDE